MVHDDSFRLHKTGRCKTAGILKRGKRGGNLVRVKNTTVQGRHNIAAFRAVFGPSRDIEKRKPAVSQPVVVLNATAPPLAKVLTYAKRQQFFLVFVRPLGKAEVIILWRNPAGATPDKNCPSSVMQICALVPSIFSVMMHSRDSLAIFGNPLNSIMCHLPLLLAIE